MSSWNPDELADAREDQLKRDLNEVQANLYELEKINAELLAACKVALPYLEECQPPKVHDGSCGPESGCDAGCMDLARWADDFHQLRSAIAKATRTPGEGQ